MPNSRYWIVIVGAPLVLGWAIGTGISPPARKLAVSWLPANRLGSARILACPSVASASMNDRRFLVPKSVQQRRELGGRRIQDDVARDLVDRVVGVENAGPDARVPARIAIEERSRRATSRSFFRTSAMRTESSTAFRSAGERTRDAIVPPRLVRDPEDDVGLAHRLGVDDDVALVNDDRVGDLRRRHRDARDRVLRGDR